MAQDPAKKSDKQPPQGLHWGDSTAAPIPQAPEAQKSPATKAAAGEMRGLFGDRPSPVPQPGSSISQQRMAIRESPLPEPDEPFDSPLDHDSVTAMFDSEELIRASAMGSTPPPASAEMLSTRQPTAIEMGSTPPPSDLLDPAQGTRPKSEAPYELFSAQLPTGRHSLPSGSGEPDPGWLSGITGGIDLSTNVAKVANDVSVGSNADAAERGASQARPQPTAAAGKRQGAPPPLEVPAPAASAKNDAERARPKPPAVPAGGGKADARARKPSPPPPPAAAMRRASRSSAMVPMMGAAGMLALVLTGAAVGAIPLPGPVSSWLGRSAPAAPSSAQPAVTVSAPAVAKPKPSAAVPAAKAPPAVAAPVVAAAVATRPVQPQPKPEAAAAAPEASAPSQPAPSLTAEPGAEAALEPQAALAAARTRLTAHDAAGAETLARSALTQDPEDHHAMEVLALALLAEGHGDEAAKLAERMIKKRPKRAAYRIIEGDAELLLGDRTGAQAAWRAALELEPGNVDAQKRLAR